MSTCTALSEEDYKIIEEFSKDKELNMIGCSHNQYYYGLKHLFETRQDIKDKCMQIETILKKYIPCFVSFSNFTGKEKNEIRFQGYYGNDHSFIGVNYLSLDELEGKNNEVN